MAATRKLQGEIDRCLKKVAEGVETFEDIWKKVHNATNSNQKEKYEADLKKEIKKLQRLRDQIKSWIASAEIKDKSALLENRRLIETQMERFKIVERETKTKAYSKEGLGAAQKMDPAQRIKDEARNWLTSSISSLQIQIDQYESEIESLLAGKKKRLDRDKQDRMDELRSKLDRHKFHVTKLETLLRLLDNDGVEAEQVNKIKDDVEYYIDSSQEPDFEENEFIYDDIIGLDEVELSGTGVSLGIPSSATTDSNNDNETSGSPSSITSGVSPITSPQPMQQQQQHIVINNQPLHQQQVRTEPLPLQVSAGALNTSGNNTTNFMQDNLNMECSNGSSLASADKRIKTDTSTIIKQPVKPTAVRAVINNKTPAPIINEASQNKISNTMPSKIHFQPPQHQTTSVINQPASATALVTSLPIVQQQLQAPGSATTNMNVLPAVTAAVNSSMHVQSVIQATPTVAFAAVAKNNASHIENASSLIRASHFVTMPSNSLTPQQLQAHTTNLSTKTTHLPNGLSSTITENNAVDAISLKTMAQEAINRTSLVSTANLTQQQQPQQNANITTNTDKSPSSSATVTSTTTTTAATNVNQIQQQNTTSMDVVTVGVEMTQNNATKTTTQTATHMLNNNTHSQQQSAVLNCNSTSAATTNVTSASLNTGQTQNPTNEAHIPPLLGVAPLGPSPLNKEHQLQFQMMEAAFYHLPQPIDSEKMATYFHRTPVQTPSHYPQSPLPIYDTVEFYQRLSTETLFFVFYYMEGSKAQYLAAKALKKQSWRFHTKYMMWFQRHEEPKIINDDYEQGTYIYFDYEKWSQRKKEGFTFEYKYLEDKELN